MCNWEVWRFSRTKQRCSRAKQRQGKDKKACFTCKSQWKSNLILIEIFQNEQGTNLNKVKQLITAFPTLTTYQLLSQLRLTSSHNTLLCWVYSLQLQALLAPGLLATKDCCLRECVYICQSLYPYFHPPHCWHSNYRVYLTERSAWIGQYYSELKTKQIIKITDTRSRVAGCALSPSSWRPLQGP